MLNRVEHWKFRPHLLFLGGHVQTVAGIYLPRRDAPYRAQQHFLQADAASPLEEGDRLVLHEDRPDAWRAGDPVVLLIHGLAGCYRSTYMCRMADKLSSRGQRVFRMDMRGCGAGQGTARGPTHCGRSEDVARALRYLAELAPQSPALIVAFSLSGSLTLNMLAEAGDERIGNFERALAICPPVDLFDVERRFATRGGRIYDRFFVKLIWKQVLERWALFPELAPAKIPPRPKRLRDIDEMVIAPAAGYRSAAEYYRMTQCGPRMAQVRQRITIIAAENDPVVPTAPLREYPHGSGIEAVYVPGGGHLGFIGRPSRDPDHRWLDWRIVDWVEQGRGWPRGEMLRRIDEAANGDGANDRVGSNASASERRPLPELSAGRR